MKQLRVFLINLFVLSIVIVATGCATMSGEYNSLKDDEVIDAIVSVDTVPPPPGFDKLFTQYGLDWLSQKLDKETRSFSTAYLSDGKQKHMVVYFEIENGVLKKIERHVEIRPGLLPYSAPGVGDYYVIYRDTEGKEIGRRTIDNPMTIRICGFTGDGDGPVGIVPVQSGTVEILIPFDPAIEFIEVKPVTDKSGLYSVGSQIRTGIKVYTGPVGMTVP